MAGQNPINRESAKDLISATDRPGLAARMQRVTSYLDDADARDKIFRAIQYGSLFASGGAPGVALDVALHTAPARKLFRLLKCLNEVEAFITPLRGIPAQQAALRKSKHLLMATYLALDHCVWAGRVGIFKNKPRTEELLKISLFCFLGGSAASACISLHELAQSLKTESSISAVKNRRTLEGILDLAKNSLDTVVAIGLLHLAPHRISHRVTGASGLLSSLIGCYQVYRLKFDKAKTI